MVKIEGNPDSPANLGRICARGLSGIMTLYDPNRVKVPLKRTNPEKGIGVDPGWVEMSWEEALDTIAEKLKKTRDEDPRKLLCTFSVLSMDEGQVGTAFGTAFGSPNFWASGAGTHCGNAEHLLSGVLHGSWIHQPDTNYCKYLLNFGVPVGTGAYYSNNAMVQRLADARINGMRHVVIDPWMGMAAEKADEWIPIRPGTDAAVALAMLNVMLNELGIYDAEYLKHHTNGPYLIGANGHYLRDRSSGKPLVWDAVDGRAKPFDDPTVKDFALEGEYTVGQTKAPTAFSVLRGHVRRYTPAMAAEVSTVPAGTIRRLATELGHAAMVGSTIVVDGRTLPYRPVAITYFKGPQGHRHATLASMAFELLRLVLGAVNVPGGTLGPNARSLGFPGTGRPAYDPTVDRDGLLGPAPEIWITPTPPYPLREVQKPESVHFQDLIPTAAAASPLIPLAILEPEKYGVPYKIAVNLQLGTNFVMGLAEPNLVASAFKDVFTVNFNLFLDETTDLADIVLPDASYLERTDSHVEAIHNIIPVDAWHYSLCQPVVPQMYQRRPAQEVLLELADRIGMRADFYTILNTLYALRAQHRLDPDEKYTWEQIVDRRYKSLFGEAHGLDWFRKNGVLSWLKKVEEVYWEPFLKVRVPIYFEFLKTAGEEIERVKRECGIRDFETSDFQPLPDWKPCPSHLERRGEYDLYCIYYRTPIHSFTSTFNNPWLDEASRMNPYVHYVAINSETARKKRLRDGDWIEIQSAGTGGKVKGRVRLTEGIHPEVIAVCGAGGHWSKQLPIASQPGKGVCVEWLLPLNFDYVDTVSLNQDLCVKVKIGRLDATPTDIDRPWERGSSLIVQ